MRVLVTGGAGYIGSHTCVELCSAGHTPVIFDNFSNAHSAVLKRLEELTGTRIDHVVGDIIDQSAVEDALTRHKCDAVLHFAGAKAVGESMQNPLKYYANNVAGTQSLLAAMSVCGVKKIIFSSSATVYGDPQLLPIPENHQLSAASVYGETKLIVENMLRNLHAADDDWSMIILRYFNPVGAHPSGLIGEDPSGVPNNLMPFITQVAVGKRSELTIFGADYGTEDGTGVRDYIHVCDLATGHVAAMGLLDSPQCTAINLGTGNGISVLEMVKAFERASGKTIPYNMKERRAGDIASCYAEVKKANELLGWQGMKTIDDMCADSWNWQSKNPNGYGS